MVLSSDYCAIEGFHNVVYIYTHIFFFFFFFAPLLGFLFAPEFYGEKQQNMLLFWNYFITGF